MKDYTPVGVECVVAANGSPYFVVQYGERPFGCEFCEWYYLYDGNGKQLTHSNPAILTDDSLPDSKQQSPNNMEFDEMADALEIGEIDVKLLDDN